MDVDRNEKLYHKAQLGSSTAYTLGVAMKRKMESDQIIFLNFSPWTCLSSLQTIHLAPRAESRECLASKLSERFDWDFYQMDSGMGGQNALQENDRVQENYRENDILRVRRDWTLLENLS